MNILNKIKAFFFSKPALKQQSEIAESVTITTNYIAPPPELILNPELFKVINKLPFNKKIIARQNGAVLMIKRMKGEDLKITKLSDF